MERESKRRDHNGFQTLADEIIKDIIYRLPIESIMICKCVSKVWNSLLNDNYCARLHLVKSKTNPHILIGTAHGTMKRYLLSVEKCNVREIAVYPHIEDKECHRGYMQIVSHFDGLICFATDHLPSAGPLVIYNPLITGDYVSLPESTGKERTEGVTLGFDHSINKYKVVKITIRSSDKSVLGCEVFTVGKDTSWRKVDFSYEGSAYFIYCMGICHQGSIYWVLKDLNNRCIIEFDMSKEVFSKVSSPRSFTSSTNYNWRGVRMHSLGPYLIITEREDRLVHFWRIVKQNNGSEVIGYRKLKMESPYAYADICDFVYLNNNENLLLLRTQGGFIPGRWSESGKRIRAPGSHFSFYRPASKKKDRFRNLPNLQRMFVGAYNVHMWRFKPSLVSIKMAMLNNP